MVILGVLIGILSKVCPFAVSIYNFEVVLRISVGLVISVYNLLSIVDTPNTYSAFAPLLYYPDWEDSSKKKIFKCILASMRICNEGRTN